MEMHQIRYFLAVADCLNFTRAAEVCNVTQPALTRAVQKLEEELGGLLFRRERKYSHMTDLGHLVRPQLEAILAQSEQAKTTAKSFLQLKDAPLKLGVMCTIGPMRFIGFLATFGRDHPGIEVSLMELVPQRLADLLMAGELDVAMMTAPAEAHRPPRPPSALRRALHDRLRTRATASNKWRSSPWRTIAGEDVSDPRQLRVYRLPGRRSAGAHDQGARCVQVRTRGLDPIHGPGRHGNLLHPGIHACHSRCHHSAHCGSGSDAHHPHRFCRRAALFTRQSRHSSMRSTRTKWPGLSSLPKDKLEATS